MSRYQFIFVVWIIAFVVYFLGRAIIATSIQNNLVAYDCWGYCALVGIVILGGITIVLIMDASKEDTLP